jgi:hypothetical protein
LGFGRVPGRGSGESVVDFRLPPSEHSPCGPGELLLATSPGSGLERPLLLGLPSASAIFEKILAKVFFRRPRCPSRRVSRGSSPLAGAEGGPPGSRLRPGPFCLMGRLSMCYLGSGFGVVWLSPGPEGISKMAIRCTVPTIRAMCMSALRLSWLLNLVYMRLGDWRYVGIQIFEPGHASELEVNSSLWPKRKEQENCLAADEEEQPWPQAGVGSQRRPEET